MADSKESSESPDDRRENRDEEKEEREDMTVDNGSGPESGEAAQPSEASLGKRKRNDDDDDDDEDDDEHERPAQSEKVAGEDDEEEADDDDEDVAEGEATRGEADGDGDDVEHEDLSDEEESRGTSVRGDQDMSIQDEGEEEDDDGGKESEEPPFAVPTNLGELQVLSLGTVLFDLQGYHDTEYIYPVGYRIKRTLTVHSPDPVQVDYTFEIRYDGMAPEGGPLFVVQRDNVRDQLHADPEKVTEDSLLKTVVTDGGEVVGGRELFGLTNARVRKCIEHLPNGDQCAEYGKTGGGAAGKKRRSAFLAAAAAGGKKGGKVGKKVVKANAGEERRALLEERKRQREEDRKQAAAEKERLKQERLKKRQEERDIQHEMREKQKQEAMRRKEEERELVRAERERRHAEIEKAKEERRMEVESHKEQERLYREQQKAALRLAERQAMVEDLELLEIYASADAWDEYVPEETLEPPPVEPDQVKDLVPSQEVGGRIPQDCVAAALEAWEFCGYFAGVMRWEPQSWAAFEQGLMEEGSPLMHAIQVELLRLLYWDLPASEQVFLGRPLNSLTWPELLRQYLRMLQLEHQYEGLDHLLCAMRVEELCVALELEVYDELPVRTRLELLTLTTHLALETQVLRDHVDSMVESNVAVQAEKRTEFANMLKEAKDTKPDAGGASGAGGAGAGAARIGEKAEKVEEEVHAVAAALAEGLGEMGEKDEYVDMLVEALEVVKAVESRAVAGLKRGDSEVPRTVRGVREWMVKDARAHLGGETHGGEWAAQLESLLARVEEGEDAGLELQESTMMEEEEEVEEEEVEEAEAEEVEMSDSDGMEVDEGDEEDALPQGDGADCWEAEGEESFSALPQVDGGEEGGEQQDGSQGSSGQGQLPAMMMGSPRILIPGTAPFNILGSSTTAPMTLPVYPAGFGQSLQLSSLLPQGSSVLPQGLIMQGALLQNQLQSQLQNSALSFHASAPRQHTPQGIGVPLSGLAGLRAEAGSGEQQAAAVAHELRQQEMQAHLQQQQQQLQQELVRQSEKFKQVRERDAAAAAAAAAKPREDRDSGEGASAGKEAGREALEALSSSFQQAQQQLREEMGHKVASFSGTPKSKKEPAGVAETAAVLEQQKKAKSKGDGEAKAEAKSTGGGGGGGGSGKEKKGSGKDPNQPKRPRTAFFQYSIAVRDTIRQENPELPFGDVSKMIGRRWSEMGAEEKEQYVELEEKDKERYVDEMKDYNLMMGIDDTKKGKKKKPVEEEEEHDSDSGRSRGGDSDGEDGGEERRAKKAADKVAAAAAAQAAAAKRKKAGGAGGILNKAGNRRVQPKKAGGGDELVDWIKCDACKEWRFFEPGLDGKTLADQWVCTDGDKECNNLSMEEEFMKDWSELVKDAEGTASYKFLLEGATFSVHELYWAVAALGGLAKLAKWKDVGNEMMMRKKGCLVSAAPGKNYGLIKNQWERWQLGRFEEAQAARPVPDAYLAPVVDPKGKKAADAAVKRESTDPHGLASPLGSGGAEGKGSWKGRKMLSRRSLAGGEPSGEGADADRSMQLSPVTSASPQAHAPLPAIPTLPPLPPLPELTREERFHLRLSQSQSYVRGLRREELAVKRRLDDTFRQRLDLHRFRTEPLGLDRFYRRYWVLGDDCSRLWLEEPTGEGCGAESQWRCYSRVEEVDALLQALDPHGVREGALKEALDLLRPALAADMARPPRAPLSTPSSHPQPPPADDAPPLPPSDPSSAVDPSGPSALEGGEGAVPAVHALRLLHRDIVSYAERFLASKTAPGMPPPERSHFTFEQSLFLGAPATAPARTHFGIPDALCSEDGAAGTKAVSAGLCKLKGDLLRMAQALAHSPEAFQEGFSEIRLQWLRSVRDAALAAELDEVLKVLIEHVDEAYLAPWYHYVPRQPKVELIEEEDGAEELAGGEAEGAGTRAGEDGEAPVIKGIADVAGDPMTVAVIALRVYGLDEALLYDGGKAPPRKGVFKKRK